MAKKRTPKQRNQQNIAKHAVNGKTPNASSNSAASQKKNRETEKDAQYENTNQEKVRSNVPTSIDPIMSRPKGLSNLGNTCFFNSVMQNLCRTPGLLFVMNEASKLSEMTFKDKNISPLTCQLPPLSKLSHSFLDFLITMSTAPNVPSNSQKNRPRTESPKALFSQICAVSSRFRGYQQQDSQELLQCLLDGIKTEEIKRRKQAILTKLGLLGKKAKDVNDEIKEKVKNYGRIASSIPTVVDIVFGGEIVSSVLCDECGRMTQVYEEFLDIPLPIAETVPLHHHHGTSCKKSGSNNQPIEEEAVGENSSDCDDDASNVKPDSVSKHARKKQRDLGRKNKNRKKRTKSQNLHELDDDQHENKSTGIENGLGSDKEVSTVNERHASGDTLVPGDYHSQQLQILNGAEEGEETLCHIGASNNISKNDQDAIDKGSDEVKELSEKLSYLSVSKLGNEHIEDMAKEMVSTILASVVSMHDGAPEKDSLDEVKEINMQPVGECGDIPLLGGKPHFSTASLDKEMKKTADVGAGSSTGCHSADAVLTSNGDSDTTPSSGNDEKSESESYKNGKAPSLFETPVKTNEVQSTSFCKKLPSSLTHRYEASKNECSISTCLHKFTMAEMLTGNNKFGCEECTKRKNGGAAKSKTVYCNASKQMLIKKPPLILTLQLKRFQQTGRNLRKFSKRVEIPLVLDISPFCIRDSRDVADDNGEIRYRLYGIVEHSGSLSRGHYTAYVCVRPESPCVLQFLGKHTVLENSDIGTDGEAGQWFHISDTSVSKCTLDRALNSNAYLIFYERIL